MKRTNKPKVKFEFTEPDKDFMNILPHKKKNRIRILTNDPSITAWGWAVVTPKGKVIESGAIQTKPSDKKLKIYKGDDRARRIREIVHPLLALIKDHNIAVLLAESPHGSQSSAAAVMLGVVAGILETLSLCLDIPLEWYNEAECKNSVSGRRSVAKDDMVAIVAKLYKVEWRDTKWIDQAVADSLAVFHLASKESSVLKMLR